MTLTEPVRVLACVLSAYGRVFSQILIDAHDVGAASQTLSTERWSLNASFLLLSFLSRMKD